MLYFIMFGMLQYDSHKKDIQFVQRDDASSMTQHSACDYCRRKKLRCSGDTTGCTRCIALSRSCAYTSSGQAKGRGQRQMSKGLSSNFPSTPVKEKTFSSEGEKTHEAQQFSENPGTASSDLKTGSLVWNSQGMQSDMDRLGQIMDFDAIFPQGTEDSETSQLPWPTRDHTTGTDMFSPLDLSMMPEYPQTPSLSHTTSRSTAPTSAAERQCACLDTIVFLIEDLDGTISCAHESPLDTSLAAAKGVLASGRRLLHCQECMRRTETLMLLLFVCEKLIHLSTSLVEQYRKKAAAENSQAGRSQEHRSVM
ncbi:hypothetical protein CC80DRAFT_588618, partial [Byssothecium circinans]